ncbi:hypothetical protein BDN72DRAFT_902876, partial [Pluteus cervinus]
MYSLAHYDHSDTTLRIKVRTDPLRVFGYAAKYEYVDILDDAAPLVLGTPLLQ